MALPERRTKPIAWPRFRLDRDRVPGLLQRLVAAQEEDTGAPVSSSLSVDGFEGKFRDVKELLETISERAWRNVTELRIELLDKSVEPAMVTTFTWWRHSGALLELTGGRMVIRNGLLPDLREVVEKVIRLEARRRCRRLITPFRGLKPNWPAIGALAALLAVLVSALALTIHAPQGSAPHASGPGGKGGSQIAPCQRPSAGRLSSYRGIPAGRRGLLTLGWPPPEGAA